MSDALELLRGSYVRSDVPFFFIKRKKPAKQHARRFYAGRYIEFPFRGPVKK